jgi:hypothetical protein
MADGYMDGGSFGDLESLRETSSFFDLFQDLFDTTREASQDIGSTTQNPDFIFAGPTSFDDLTSSVAQSQGVFTYQQSGVPLFNNLLAQDGSYDFVYKVDFGARTAGGGPSSIDISGNSSLGNKTFSLGMQAFGPSGFALFDYSFSDSGCGSSACTVDVSVNFYNSSTTIADQAVHSVHITDPNTLDTMTGGGVADHN